MTGALRSVPVSFKSFFPLLRQTGKHHFQMILLFICCPYGATHSDYRREIPGVITAAAASLGVSTQAAGKSLLIPSHHPHFLRHSRALTHTDRNT